MRNPESAVDIRTLQLAVHRTGELATTCLALTHQAKNIVNTGLYLVRQVLTAYDYNRETKQYQLKAELHPAQQAALDHVNAQVRKINTARALKHAEKLKAHPDAKLKLLSLLEATMKHPLSLMMDATLLDNAVREWTGNKAVSVYKRLPGVLAQQVVRNLRDSLAAYQDSVRAWYANPSKFTGKPGLPRYKDKHARAVIEIPVAMLRDGVIPGLKNKQVPVDYAESRLLSLEELAYLDGVDLLELAQAAARKRGWAECTPKELRIVPTGTGVKIECVVAIANPYPENSFMSRFLAEHQDTLVAFKSSTEREQWLLEYCQSLPAARLPRLAGVDPGVDNFVTIAYSTGHKARVVESGRFEQVVSQKTAVLDELVSKNTTARAKELQGKKTALQEKNEKLTKAEHLELNTLLAATYREAKYLRLREALDQWKDDYLHKLSAGIVQDLVAKRIEVLVLGQNKGWKQESGMGRTQNKRFHQRAHARLYELLRYKAEAHGILVITTEESYTSKTSFVNNADLMVHGKEPETKAELNGKRGVGNQRRWFRNKDHTGRFAVVHADVNGAMNILRKAFHAFGMNARLTLKFIVMRVSARFGLVPVLLAPAPHSLVST